MKIKWVDYFTLSEESFTGLLWKHTVLDSLGRQTKSKAGTVAGGYDGTRSSQVMIAGKTYKCHRIIYEMIHGDIEDSLVVDHLDRNSRNNCPSNLILKTQRHNSMNCRRSKNNSTGATGVCFWTNRDGLIYARAQWTSIAKVNKSKSFRVDIHGLLPAFKMAVEYRQQQIALLNNDGANYTEGHGT